jgi:hypothetical protein
VAVEDEFCGVAAGVVAEDVDDEFGCVLLAQPGNTSRTIQIIAMK